MEGAGSLRLANWLYNVANKNGTVIGTIGRGTGFDPLFGHKAAQFDGNKFNWIGSANDEVSVCVVWNGRTKITKFDDLLTMPLDRRRHRRRRRHRPVPAHHQRRARHPDEDRHRLSRRQRRQSRARARRGRRPLRLVVVERDLDPRVVAQGEEDHRPDAALAGEASRSARRSADHRSRQERRAARDPAPDLRAAGAGSSLSRAARTFRRIASPRCARRSWTR